MNDERIEIIVAGRNRDKMIQDVNIVKVAASIRGTLRTHISIVDGCDLSDIDSIRKCLSINRPDIVVNTSRVYVQSQTVASIGNVLPEDKGEPFNP